MFLERRSNGVWYYKKTHTVDGTRKVTRKSLNTYDKKEAQLRAMQLYFNIEDIPAVEKSTRILDDGFVIQTTPELSKSTNNGADAPRPEASTNRISVEPAIEDTPTEAATNHNGLSSIVDAYLAENVHLWGTKESKTQKSAINRFISNSNITNLKQCSKTVAVEFKQSLIASGLSNISINKFIGKLSNLFDYIQAHYEHPNIFDGLKIKRAKQQTTRTAYTQTEAQELIKFAHKQS